MKSKNVLFTFISIILFLILAEIVLGLAFWIKDGQDMRLRSIVKDAPYLYYLQDIDKPQAETKNSSKYTIVIVGGSVARQLTDYDSLDSILNSKLNTSCIEVLNAGMDGYVIQQEFLLTQLVLQHYKPDLIFGVDGYNDMLSFHFNRYLERNQLIPPQGYRDFLVIEKGKYESKFYYRFAALFKNVTRTIDFVQRMLSGKSAYDYSMVTDQELLAYSQTYANTLKDLNEFCKIKLIKYYNFLQPVRFYDKSAVNYLRNNQGTEKLAKMIHHFEDQVTATDFGFSLSELFDNKQQHYIDDCHFDKQGKRILVAEIASILASQLEKDSVFLKIKNDQKSSITSQ